MRAAAAVGDLRTLFRDRPPPADDPDVRRQLELLRRKLDLLSDYNFGTGVSPVPTSKNPFPASLVTSFQAPGRGSSVRAIRMAVCGQ